MYEVIVGNIGSVYRGEDQIKAYRTYSEYVKQSKTYKGGRAYRENVFLLGSNDNIIREHEYSYELD